MIKLKVLDEEYGGLPKKEISKNFNRKMSMDEVISKKYNKKRTPNKSIVSSPPPNLEPKLRST